MPHSSKSKKEIKYEWKWLRDVQHWLVSLFHTSHKSQSVDGKQLGWTAGLLGGSHFLASATGGSSPLPSCEQLMTMQVLQGSVKTLWGYCRVASCAQKPSSGRTFRVFWKLLTVALKGMSWIHAWKIMFRILWLWNGRYIRQRIYFVVILPCKVKAMDHLLRSHINLAPGYPQQKEWEVNCQCPFLFANS